MRMNLRRWHRVTIYIVNAVGTPFVVYARAKGWIGDLELALWGAEISAAFTIAGLNVPDQPR